MGGAEAEEEKLRRTLEYRVIDRNVGEASAYEAIRSDVEVCVHAEEILDVKIVSGGAEEIGVLKDNEGVNRQALEVDVDTDEGIGIGNIYGGGVAVRP